ncbi:methylated-DNA--[protein]-cysteine S-methyltransferase [cf. Phormidesmis sp. LEGE 11477]|uniref:methylated-DNA--[protein]-cysteine S-methyltransferase n=1 Tax=cf. Phormidesmis sp. LEGE 11477 TaxID=1828680 RepID=UPI00187F46FC|nr:methylated-DNA--[protein]-cysteine S-methyltransferase [cf. Phormidesmis sp. LEGE 11477]MBE9061221.1 methylated-DNA--[protein]-cysteine S-methyltransferase [cf. Phormidesmis sp. LEGE 11477]
MSLPRLDLKDDLLDHYQMVAAAISFIRQHQAEQPDLSVIARHVGLSEYHFQKLFTHWAGISPKRFLQYLTIEQAKANISRTDSLLKLSIDLGLSGPSRLHDLFVSIEAMSPGEYKNGGEGLDIHYGSHSTLFGAVAIAATKRGICSLHFLGDGRGGDLDNGESDVGKLLSRTWPHAQLVREPEKTQALCDHIFSPAMTQPHQPLTLLVKGTNFQLQVWRALLQIPSGSLTTYKTIAEIIERPTAVRAVGTAIGKNPIGYLIPCHRVIRGSGEVGGYRWGSDRKQAILGWEAAQSGRH